MMRALLLRPQTVPLRRAILSVHRLLGVIGGLYFLVVCVTGAALVFRIDMQRALSPHLFEAPTRGPVADLASLVAALERAYPGYRVSGIDAPTSARATAIGYVTRGNEFRTVIVDPVSGRVIGELPEHAFIRTLQQLHFNLLGGRTGRIVNGIGSVCLLAMTLTGLVIWWPGLVNWRRALVVEARRGGRRLAFDLHRSIGLWTMLLIGMWSVTGIAFAFPTAFRSTISLVSPVTSAQAPRSNVAMRGLQPRPDLETLIQEAQRRMPGRHAARIVLPSTEEAAVQVLFATAQPTPAGPNALESVYLDQHTGGVLEEGPHRRTAGDTVLAWVRPVHAGDFSAPAVKWVWFTIGLAPALLVATGLVMWWTRERRRRPPPRWTYS